MPMLQAIGADGAHGGWATVRCFADAPADVESRRTELSLWPTFAELVATASTTASTGVDAASLPDVDAPVPVAVDVPMGLMETVGLRPCDQQAQDLLAHRRSTIFAPSSRPLLAATDYADARALVEKLREAEPAAKSLSAQAFGIAPKVAEVDAWLREHPHAQAWLYECHPELSFRALADGRILDDKKSAHGQLDRLALIEREFPDARAVIAASSFRSRDVQLVDILDAYAALASALHVAAGDHEELGGETDGEGLVMRIVF